MPTARPLHHARPRVLALGLALVLSLQSALLVHTAAGASQEGQDAEAILADAATAMADVESFQFTLTTEQGQTVFMDNLELEDVNGAVQRPDRFRAAATAKVAILEVDIEVVGVGDRLWISNPIGSGEEYIEVDLREAGAEQAVAELVNPDRILLRAVELLEEPEILGEEEIDGVQTTVIEGIFDPRDALDLLPGTPAAAAQAAATEAATDAGIELAGPVPTLIWIDEAGLVRRIRVEGPVLTTEQTDVVRRLDLFAYDEPVDIQPPA